MELATVAHRMGLPAGRGCVRGGRPRTGGPEAELPVLPEADVVLVWELAVRARAGGPALGQACLVSEVRDEPDAVAVVPAGAAAGRSERDRRRAGGGGERSGDGTGSAGAGRAARDAARVAEAVPGSGADPNGRLRGTGGGLGRGGRGAVGRAGAGGAGGAGDGLDTGSAAAGRGRGRRLRVRQPGHRRGAAWHQREPALGRARRSGFDATRPRQPVTEELQTGACSNFSDMQTRLEKLAAAIRPQ